MKTLIIGAGEIGKSLARVFVGKHEVWLKDVGDEPYPYSEARVSNTNGKVEPFEVLNICYPPNKDFVKITKEYIKKYNPKITIIHSTVAPGTTDKCGPNVVHSPVHGKHPDISGGLMTWKKYIGGPVFATQIACDFMAAAGIKARIVGNAKTSEISKILCTTYYGWNIVFMKEVVKICEKYDVNFGMVYSHWNMDYNEGCAEARDTHGMFMRPVLKPMPGKIGGHCVVENCHLLPSDITEFIIKKNEEYKK